MATWEDGPEYAPVERPTDFAAVPDVAALEVAPPPFQPAAAAPKDRPQFSDPPVPVAPLATLVPAVEDPRDPTTPFQVVASTLTSQDPTNAVAWGAAHWSPPNPATSPAGPWGPPSGSPAPAPSWPAPQLPLQPSAGPAPSPTGYPSPGTTEWFGSAPYGAYPAPSGAVDIRRVGRALTPGLIITAAIGGFIFPMAPVTVVVAFLLSGRATAAKTQVRRVWAMALGGVGFFALVGALTRTESFGSWWSFVGLWSLAISWVALAASGLLVYRALKDPNAQPPAATSSWG